MLQIRAHKHFFDSHHDGDHVSESKSPWSARLYCLFDSHYVIPMHNPGLGRLHFMEMRGMLQFSGIIICLLTALAGLNSCHREAEEVVIPEEIDFNFHVRPILSNNCFLCHGPDPSSREADLRLDEEQYTLMSRDGSKPAIVPGNADASLIMQRVESHDPAFRMPPPETNKQLTPTEIAILRKWIDDGAEWKPYWAFIPPEDPIVPDQGRPHAVDNFLEEQRVLHQISTSGVAGPYTLLRRLSFVLTGLPPTDQEIDRFITDKDSILYDECVDYYLASPHFGERWARHWMDLARYAEGRGHEFDYPIVGAWRYRDYLIRAFNEDVPYHHLVMEQLAGDVMQNPRLHPAEGFNESVLGTTFLMLAEGKHSPVDIKEEEKIMIDNVIDVTSKTFLGLTVACARCHDHKFDPIPTTDYYALYGIFESTQTDLVPARNQPEEVETLKEIDSLKTVVKSLMVQQVDLESLRPIATPVARKEAQTGLKDVEVFADFRDGDLDGWYANGLAFKAGNVIGEPETGRDGKTRLASGKVSSKPYGKGLMGTLRSPNFTIDKQKIVIRAAGQMSMVRIVVDNFQLIQDPIYGSLDHELNSDEPQDYVLDLNMVQGHQAYLEFLSGRMVRQNGKFHHYDIPRDAWMEVSYVLMCDSLPDMRPESEAHTYSDPQGSIEHWMMNEATPEERQTVLALLEEMDFTSKDLDELFEEIDFLSSSLYDSSFVVGASEGARVLSPVFVRGDHRNLSEELVPHRFLTALDPDQQVFDKTSSGRLELAQAITAPDNPLTSRVMVNRIWHHVFGRGIVETVDNFGLQGSIPSHPRLLDHLAVKFVRDGWSIKEMIRYLVSSDAFKMSTVGDTLSDEKDPRNIYLSRYPIRRVEAEAIRDAILAVSGSLDTTMFGPSIPIHLTSFLSGRGRPPASGPLDGEGRRSIYQALWRNFLPPMMLTFDMPIPFSTFGKRMVTNVPAQSLTLLNDPFVIDQAGRWAVNAMAMNEEPEQVITTLYLRAFTRHPSDIEIAECITFMQEQAEQYDISHDKMWEDERVWKDLCHSIINMKEFIYLM